MFSFPQTMEHNRVQLELKTEHIEFLDKLKQEYGAHSRSRALEILLDDLLKPEENVSCMAYLMPNLRKTTFDRLSY